MIKEILHMMGDREAPDGNGYIYRREDVANYIRRATLKLERRLNETIYTGGINILPVFSNHLAKHLMFDCYFYAMNCENIKGVIRKDKVEEYKEENYNNFILTILGHRKFSTSDRNIYTFENSSKLLVPDKGEYLVMQIDYSKITVKEKYRDSLLYLAAYEGLIERGDELGLNKAKMLLEIGMQMI